MYEWYISIWMIHIDIRTDLHMTAHVPIIKELPPLLFPANDQHVTVSVCRQKQIVVGCVDQRSVYMLKPSSSLWEKSLISISQSFIDHFVQSKTQLGCSEHFIKWPRKFFSQSSIRSLNINEHMEQFCLISLPSKLQLICFVNIYCGHLSSLFDKLWSNWL